MGQDASPRRGQTVRFTYGQTGCVEWGNVTAPSRCLRSLARSLPVNVSTAERSHGPQSDRLHTYYICGAGNSPAARSASSSSLRDEGRGWRPGKKKKRTEGGKKKKINLHNKCKSAEKGWWNGCLSTLQWFPYPLCRKRPITLLV